MILRHPHLRYLKHLYSLFFRPDIGFTKQNFGFSYSGLFFIFFPIWNAFFLRSFLITTLKILLGNVLCVIA